MEYTNLNIRTPKDVKAQAELIFDELGISTTAAFNIFLRQVIRSHGIPFSLTLDTPNEVTAKALKDAEEGNDIHGPFTNVEDLIKSLQDED